MKLLPINFTNTKPTFGYRLSLSHPDSLGICGRWLLNEYAGNKVLDSFQSKLIGTISGATWVSDGLLFSSDTLLLGFSAIGSLLNGAPAITLYARVTPTSVGSPFPQVVGEYVNGGSNGFNLRIDDVGGGNFRFRAGGRSQGADSFQSLQESSSRPFGVECDVTMVLDYANDQIRLWVDGIEDAASPKSVSFGASTYTHGSPTSQDFFMWSGLGGQTNGTLHEVGVWCRAFSHEEVVRFTSNPYGAYAYKNGVVTGVPLVSAGRISRYHDLSGLGGQGQMTWNPLG